MVITGTVLAADALRAGGDSTSLDLRLYLIFGGTLSGMLLAGLSAWLLFKPLASTYRRGGLAIVCAFATVPLMLVCIPVFERFGRPGLLSLLAFCGLSAVLLAAAASWLRTRT
ncbi:MAG TPA: hypothetical protein VFS51_07720 [Gemmatimonadales bacterium]|jgi:hypothetical protein|nr:hypothetical protein [Gemmatimonadales bacterium]